jgi:hypothetical protein
VPDEPERGEPRTGAEDLALRRLLDLVRHPERVADLTTTGSASVLCHIASVLAALSARLAHSAVPQRAKRDDRLLTVDEVAQRLSIS